jgi:hypothetical protein
VAIEPNGRFACLAASRPDSKRHSDKMKFCNDLNEQKGCELSEYSLRAQMKFEDFQSEYKLSKWFNALQHHVLRGDIDDSTGSSGTIKSLIRQSQTSPPGRAGF